MEVSITVMRMPGGILSIKKSGLISRFQSEGKIYMVAETLEDYALASSEAAYENLGEQEPMGLMAVGREIQVSENTPPWMDCKHSSFPSRTST